ncbi:MAG: DNA cytosine methyltransferase [Cyanobacteria bacterium P01_H01_bin.15]
MKRSKGRVYAYLAESVRDRRADGSSVVRQKIIKSLGLVSGEQPNLPRNAPRAVVLFAGGSGVECGMVMAGIRPVCSVECDPGNPKLSNALADANELNFRRYGHKVIRSTVEELAALGLPGVPRDIDFLHASPVCSRFSMANHRGSEQFEDLTQARAVALAIQTLKPRVFTLENVPSYRKSESMEIIRSALDGFGVDERVLNAKDFGVPQDRKRLILRAVRGGMLPALPKPSPVVGWYAALKDLIPRLPESFLLDDQKRVVADKLKQHPDVEALLVERIGWRDKPKVRLPWEPCWTIRASITGDQRGGDRRRFIDVWFCRGEVKSLTVQGLAMLQEFPDWYRLPVEISVAGALVGYAIPPSLIFKVYEKL